MASALSGILVIDKHRGISSAGVLTRVKSQFPKPLRPKFGHAGTLDPFATGVLLVLVGKGTKQCERLMGQPKRYLATIKLGAETPTLDPLADEIPDPHLDPTLRDQRDQIEKDILPDFVGDILQAPPAFCALKLSGQRAYELAKRGKPVNLEPRMVRVYSIDLVAFEFPYLQVDIRCGKGTYIRSLARDIAGALGTTGYLTQLVRTAIGDYTIDQAIDVEIITAANMAQHLQQV